MPASKLVKSPDGLDADRAAGVSVTYGTTLHALKDRAKLKAGRNLGRARRVGGTGLAAIELGKIMGARVIACASSADKIALLQEARRRRRDRLQRGRSEGFAAAS